MYVGVWGCWYIYIYNVKPCTTLRGQTGRKVVFTCLTHPDKTKPVTSYILTTLHSQKNNTYDIDNDKNESLTWRSSHSHAHKLINYRTKLGKLYIYIAFLMFAVFPFWTEKTTTTNNYELEQMFGLHFFKEHFNKRKKSESGDREQNSIMCIHPDPHILPSVSCTSEQILVNPTPQPYPLRTEG